MTQLTATFTVTIKTKPDGDYYFDHDDLVRNVVPWIEGGLDDRDDIAEVTITEQATEEAHAELRHARAALARIRQMADYWEQHLPEVIRTPAVVSALRAALDTVSSAAVAPPTGRAPYGSPDCTCVPFTRKDGTPRACGPHDTVDDISGWETGRNCPDHAPAAPPTDPTHGLSVQHADALWDAVAIPGPRTATYPEQHERVCRAVRDILDELTPARADADAQTALRDRIAEALMQWAEGNNSPKYTSMRRPETVVQNAYSRADAVLAVLPEAADRAAIYAEVAERLATDAEQGDKDGLTRIYRRSAAKQVREWADQVRRMADETATTETGCWCGHPEDRHWIGATNMPFSDGCHDCRGWNGAHAYGQELPWLPEGDEPAAGARQDGAHQ
jgi:hypothetical protein